MTRKANPPRYQTGRIFLSVLRLDPLPACAALGVDDLDALAFSSSRMRSASAKFFAFFASYRASTSASMAGSPSPVTV